MKIELLLKREPFFEILNETLKRFLKINDLQIFVQHNSPKFIKSSFEHKNILLCNSKLNVIFQSNCSRDCFKQIRSEFSFNPNKLLNLVQTLYVNVVLTSPFSHFFSDYVLVLNKQISILQNKIIIGGNNRIRILDFDNNESYVILKENFDDRFFINELKIRKSLTTEFIPKLTKIEDSEKWFAEEIINGKPLNRLNNKSLYDENVKKSFEFINSIYSKTRKTTNIKSYSNYLIEKIANLLNFKSFEDYSEQIMNLTKSLLSKISSNFELMTTLTHGDFQEANILLDRQNLWIIDWENADRRAEDYDMFTFFLKARNLNQFEKKFINTYNNIDLFPGNQYGINIGDEYPKERLIVFLIENLVFSLWQNKNEMFYKPDEYFFNFLDILQRIDKNI